MKTILVLLALATALAAPAHATGGVTVRFDATILDAAPLAGCDVTVAAGSNVGDVLDQAVADGCISSWESKSFPGFGRYVTCIESVCEQVPTYWAFYVDGAYATEGIDSTIVAEGASYSFDYTQWVVQL